VGSNIGEYKQIWHLISSSPPSIGRIFFSKKISISGFLGSMVLYDLNVEFEIVLFIGIIVFLQECNKGKGKITFLLQSVFFLKYGNDFLNRNMFIE